MCNLLPTFNPPFNCPINTACVYIRHESPITIYKSLDTPLSTIPYLPKPLKYNYHHIVTQLPEKSTHFTTQPKPNCNTRLLRQQGYKNTPTLTPTHSHAYPDYLLRLPQACLKYSPIHQFPSTHSPPRPQMLGQHLLTSILQTPPLNFKGTPAPQGFEPNFGAEGLGEIADLVGWKKCAGDRWGVEAGRLMTTNLLDCALTPCKFTQTDSLRCLE